MTDLVPNHKIEQIVGHKRHQRIHFGRAESAERIMYVLHSYNCLEQNPDLRECEFSVALDNGLDMDFWEDCQDEAVPLSIVDGSLWPDIVAGGTRD